MATEGDLAPCPACGTPMLTVANGGLRHECPNCKGRLVGLSPFERMLQDGVGARIWVASGSGDPGGPCPFCGQPMRGAPADAAAPAGLAVCHTCQQVWIPASASDWMAANGSRNEGPGVMAQAPSECGNCGAPYQPDEMGRCEYCHAQIAAPAPIVFQIEQPTVPAAPVGGLLGALASALTDLS